jgi:hypothetical protein
MEQSLVGAELVPHLHKRRALAFDEHALDWVEYHNEMLEPGVTSKAVSRIDAAACKRNLRAASAEHFPVLHAPIVETVVVPNLALSGSLRTDLTAGSTTIAHAPRTIFIGPLAASAVAVEGLAAAAQNGCSGFFSMFDTATSMANATSTKRSQRVVLSPCIREKILSAVQVAQ